MANDKYRRNVLKILRDRKQILADAFPQEESFSLERLSVALLLMVAFAIMTAVMILTKPPSSSLPQIGEPLVDKGDIPLGKPLQPTIPLHLIPEP